jgi:SAM-dependent methyltransferase
MTLSESKAIKIANYLADSKVHSCRFCGVPLRHTFVNLGMSPLCESYRSAEQMDEMEPFYPLHVYVCGECFLVQLPEYVAPEQIFTEYAYFSSYSDSWLAHAREYVDRITQRFQLSAQHQVVEVASNDGYLLQYFMSRGIPVLGIEPAANVAEAAIRKGIPSIVKFFGVNTAEELVAEGKRADLLLGNNVLAHVPDLNDFVAGLKVLLAPAGVVTMEFPHLMRLMEGNQFDTIYHEHFSYLSLLTVDRVFAAHGLRLFDVEELPSHGGSLRIFACHRDCDAHGVLPSVKELIEREVSAGLDNLEHYRAFDEQVKETKRKLLEFLIRLKREGKTIAGYGAPGKGNTLLNYCGIRTDFIDYVVDRNPYKHGKFLPGTGIPIFPPEHLAETKPDYVLILPWNLKQEIAQQLSYIDEWNARLFVPIPEVQVLS